MQLDAASQGVQQLAETWNSWNSCGAAGCSLPGRPTAGRDLEQLEQLWSSGMQLDAASLGVQQLAETWNSWNSCGAVECSWMQPPKAPNSWPRPGTVGTVAEQWNAAGCSLPGRPTAGRHLEQLEQLRSSGMQLDA